MYGRNHGARRILCALCVALDQGYPWIPWFFCGSKYCALQKLFSAKIWLLFGLFGAFSPMERVFFENLGFAFSLREIKK